MLKGEDNVFKLVGPVLLKQDLIEAQQTVSKRIEYIEEETWVNITSRLFWIEIQLNTIHIKFQEETWQGYHWYWG